MSRDRKAYYAAYNAAHREERVAYAAAYRAEHSEEIAAYRAAHKDEIAAYSAAWYEAHKAEKAAYRAAHKKEAVAYDAAYYATHKLEALARRRLRRAREREVDGAHTAADVRGQYVRQKGKCFWCGAKVGKQYHVDHVVPLSKGGSNWPENLVIACAKCNTQKGSKLPHEWAQGGRLI